MIVEIHLERLLQQYVEMPKRLKIFELLQAPPVVSKQAFIVRYT